MKLAALPSPRRGVSTVMMLATALVAACVLPPSAVQAAEPDCSIAVSSTTVARGATGLSASVPDLGEGATYAWELSGANAESGVDKAILTWAAPESGPAKLSISVADHSGAQCSDEVQITVADGTGSVADTSTPNPRPDGATTEPSSSAGSGVRVSLTSTARLDDDRPNSIVFRLAMNTEGSKGFSPTVLNVLPVGYAGSFVNSMNIDAFKAASGLPDPKIEVIGNYQGSGRQALRWSWPGSSMKGDMGGSQVFGSFSVMVFENGMIKDEAYLLAGEDSVSDNPLCTKRADTWDADADGDTNELACYDSSTVPTPEFANGTADLRVKGSLDATSVGRMGVTLPPEEFSYELRYWNSGRAPLRDVVLYDILPAVEDVYVSEAMGGASRNSAWQVDLAGKVTSDFAGTTSVEYSNSLNPCREEVYPDAPGCVDDWTTSAASDLSTIRAIRIRLTGATLARGAGVHFTIPVKPHSATVTGVAFNSVASTATMADCIIDCGVLVDEPARTGVEAAPVGGSPSGIVYLVQDGTQTPLEGVRITSVRISRAQ